MGEARPPARPPRTLRGWRGPAPGRHPAPPPAVAGQAALSSFSAGALGVAGSPARSEGVSCETAVPRFPPQRLLHRTPVPSSVTRFPSAAPGPAPVQGFPFSAQLPSAALRALLSARLRRREKLPGGRGGGRRRGCRRSLGCAALPPGGPASGNPAPAPPRAAGTCSRRRPRRPPWVGGRRVLGRSSALSVLSCLFSRENVSGRSRSKPLPGCCIGAARAR